MFGRNRQDVTVTRKGNELFVQRRGERTAQVIRVPGDVSAVTDPGCGEIDAEIVDEGGR